MQLVALCYASGMDYTSVFKDKKVTVMGLGLLGRGVGDSAWLARAGAELIVTDTKSAEELAPSLKWLSEFPDISYRLGEHWREDFRDRDLVLKAAGVPLDSPFIAEARQNGSPVDMSASLFMRLTGIPVVGVTGTRGKSTVTHLVHAILTHAGRKTLLGGNVRGVANLALLNEVTDEHIGVFELDSWQCQGLGESYSLRAPEVKQGPHSPSVAVFTTFMDDHMNYYQGDRDRYLADKAQLFLHQHESDHLVLGRQALESLQSYKTRMRAHVTIADETSVPKSWKPQLLGAHNRYNIGVAVETARILGVDEDDIQEAVERFSALPGRLEPVGEYAGMRAYNDTNATTPDAAAASLAALRSIGEESIVLIAGGTDKGLSLTPLLEALNKEVHLVLLPGTGTDRLLAEYQGEYVLTESLEDALTKAASFAGHGRTLLFSPGFASFGLFKNEYDRGEQFVSGINSGA